MGVGNTMGHPVVRLESDPFQEVRSRSKQQARAGQPKALSGVWGPQSQGQASGREDTRMWGKEGRMLSGSVLHI